MNKLLFCLLFFAAAAMAAGKSIYDFSLNSIDGQPASLSAYKGKVVMLVNTASQCGLTPQYAGLEALYAKYKDRGLVVLGFPANNFAAQEPGSDGQIAEFCRTAYDIQFPMFSKISVKGEDIHPLYKTLTTLPPPLGGEVLWNFQKYLLDRQGSVVAKFSPQTKPEDPALVAKIEALLAEGA